ncbi:zinc finger protein 878 [Bicyclus anynana]|uniref:Zinc finger protein 878 n=1 Tax=Bicyclus anynana TaxID=110368 RepID=A0ABM3M3E5_BICAN|nr:zinc finger protein 878 [Bicyclus anynana]
MVNKEGIMNNLLCTACLCIGRTIKEIYEEEHKKFYFEVLKELPINNSDIVPRVCWECKAMLEKVLSFREQVKDCYRILRTYIDSVHDSSLLDISRAPRLKVHSNDAVIITPRDSLLVKLEDNDKCKELSKSDTADNGPTEDIQTVLCDVKKREGEKSRSKHKIIKQYIRHRVKTKRTKTLKTSKVKSKRTLKTNVDPVAVNEACQTDVKVDTSVKTSDVKLEDLNNGNVNEDCQMDVKVEVDTHVKIDDVKSEINNDVDEDAMSNEGSLKSFNSDSDSDDDSDRDIDAKIQNFLDDIKKNKHKSTKIKKKRKTEKKVSKYDNILTVDLSYDEMQTERSLRALCESFTQAPHKCSTCLLVFNCASSLDTHHEKKHKAPGDYICSICRTIVSSVEAFTAHYKRHMKRYECALCHKRATDIKSIQQHLHTRHQITLRKYTCKLCGKVSKSVDTHRYHCDMHKSRVQCPQCDKTFSHRAGLMNHRLAVHEAQNQFPCTLCDKVFRWKTSLKRHLEKHKNEESSTVPTNKAYCESCDIGFSSVCSLQRHLRNSLKHVTYDQLKFICDHCDQRYVDKTKLRDHIEEKHLYRTFQCHICHKPSKNRVGLEQHVRTVHTGRPNNRICHHCGKGFPTNLQLESHIRTHTGERPFMCEYCPATFSQQSNLYKHHRQVHLNMKSKRYPLCKKSKADGNQTDDPQPPFPIAIMQYIPENGFSF